MSIKKFIAQNNTQGVVDFAAKNGVAIPANADVAEDFLDQAMAQDPVAVLAAMKDLHPHGKFLYSSFNANGNGPQMPGKADCNCASCKSKKGHRNFTEGEVDEYVKQSEGAFTRGIEKGKEMATNVFGGLQNYYKDHSKEILTYGGLLLVGIVIGYHYGRK